MSHEVAETRRRNSPALSLSAVAGSEGGRPTHSWWRASVTAVSLLLAGALFGELSGLFLAAAAGCVILVRAENMGSAILVSIAALSPAASAVGASAGLAPRGLYILLGISLTVVALSDSLHRMRIERTRVATAALIAVFALLAYFRMNPASFLSGREVMSGDEERILSLQESLVLAAFWTLFVALAVGFISLKRDAVLWSLAIVGLVVGVLAVIAGLLESGSTIWIGRCFALSFVAAFTIRRGRFIRGVVVGLALAGLLAVGHQGPIVAAIVGLIVALLLRARHLQRAAVLVSLTALLLAIYLFLERWLLQFLDAGSSLTARADLAANTLAALGSAGVWGAGTSVQPVGLAIRSHNSLLEVAYGLGLVGSILWLTIVVVFIRDSRCASILPVWLTAWVFSMSSGILPSNPEYWIVGAAASSLAAGGAISWSSRLHKQSVPTDPRAVTDSRPRYSGREEGASDGWP